MDYGAMLLSFDSYQQREEFLYERYTEVLGEEGVENLIEIGFLKAPASTKYHGNYEGGLFDHSVNVATVLADLTRCNNLKWERPDSPYRIGILHDLCKVDQYKSVLDEVSHQTHYEYDNSTIIKGHGTKSVIYSQSLGISLNGEEIACVLYHMGAFTDSSEWKDYTGAVRKYPNVLWTHHADMIASQIMGV